MKTLAVLMSTILLLSSGGDFGVQPTDITFTVKSGRVTPGSVTLKITCPDDIPWEIEHPPGFGGEKSGVGTSYVTVYPLGNLQKAKTESDLIVRSEFGESVVQITVKRELPIEFDMRVFPDRRTFHPGDSGEFKILITCPNPDACGQIKFTEPAEHVSGRVAVIPNYIMPPGVASVGMGSSRSTNPRLFTLPVRAESRNRKQGATIKSDVVALGELPENPEAEVSSDEIAFTRGCDESDKIISITPLADEGLFIWEAVPNKPWIDLTPKQGKGSSEIKVSLYRDGVTADQDDGLITLKFPGVQSVEKTIRVQLKPNPANYFSVSESEVRLGPPETLYSPSLFHVQALEDVSWEISKKPEWLMVSADRGTGNACIACYASNTGCDNNLVEGELIIRLTDYPDILRVVPVKRLIVDEFLPKDIDLTRWKNGFRGEMICSSFSPETLVVKQPSNGWVVNVDSSYVPKISVYVRRMWGVDDIEEVTLYRHRTGLGLAPTIHSLVMKLLD
jgi:hypothetical protein